MFTASSLFLREAQIYRTDPTFVMTLPVAVLAALTASAAAALTPSHGYAASFAGGRPIAAAVWRDGAHQDLQFPGMEAGFTVSAWLKFGDTSASRVQPALEITIEDDCCFFMYPGKGGYQFGSGGPTEIFGGLGAATDCAGASHSQPHTASSGTTASPTSRSSSSARAASPVVSSRRSTPTTAPTATSTARTSAPPARPTWGTHWC